MVRRRPCSSSPVRRVVGSVRSPSTPAFSRRRLFRRSAAALARNTVHRPVTRLNALDPYEELSRQDAIHRAAVAVIEDVRRALTELAEASNDHAYRVICEQEDWPQRIEDSLSDLMEDSFACLPDAIARAAQELGREE